MYCSCLTVWTWQFVCYSFCVTLLSLMTGGGDYIINTVTSSILWHHQAHIRMVMTYYTVWDEHTQYISVWTDICMWTDPFHRHEYTCYNLWYSIHLSCCGRGKESALMHDHLEFRVAKLMPQYLWTLLNFCISLAEQSGRLDRCAVYEYPIHVSILAKCLWCCLYSSALRNNNNTSTSKLSLDNVCIV